MDQKKVLKQMVEFNKMAFDNTFKAMIILQDETERLFSRFMDKALWLPDAGKNAINEWVSTYRRTIEACKCCNEESYKKIINYFNDIQPNEIPKSKKS